MIVILRRCAKNAVLGIPWLGRQVFRSHPLGVEADLELLQDSLNFYRSRTSFAGKRVLEIGPGRSLETLKAAIAEGAVSCAAADVSPEIDAAEAAAAGVDYRIYPGEILPFDEASFDLVISHDVFEHLRKPETTVAEVQRVLAPGGELVCTIGLMDHFFCETERLWNDCLKYGDKIWWLMTSNRGSWISRLRKSDWRRIFESAGFEEVDYRFHESEVLAIQPRPRRVRDMSVEDFVTYRIDVQCRR